jgi:hypothetical protein
MTSNLRSCVLLSCEPVKRVGGGSFGVPSSKAVGLQAGGPGPSLRGHGQSSTLLSQRLGSAAREP